MEELLISTCKMRVQAETGPVDIRPGEKVDPRTIPPNKLDNLVGRGCLVAEGSLTHEEDGEKEPDSTLLATPVTDLGLPKQVVTALDAVELRTVGDIATYGQQNGTLTAINGIGESTEKAIQEAITKLA